jgi:dTDP-4-dehydrorhamnose 3,5-epimerase
MIKDVLITPLEIINVTDGNVLHGMKAFEESFCGFGEAYFSEINHNAVKAWKRHKEMTLNLIVPIGEIRFVLFDDRSGFNNMFQEVTISKDNYCRLTVPPMVWIGFQGMSKSTSMLLNIANIEHNPEEADIKDIKDIEFKWEGL